MNGQTDPIDEILSRETHLTPPPGFAASVMEAVHFAAAPAFAFPWKRFFLGVVATALLGWLASLGVTGKLRWIDGGVGHLPLTIISVAVLLTFVSLRLSNALSADAG